MSPLDGRDVCWFGPAGAGLKMLGKPQATLRVQAAELATSEGVQWRLGAGGDRRPAECAGCVGAWAWLPRRQSCRVVITGR